MQTFQKAETLLDTDMPTELDIVPLNSALEQLERKRDILRDLDQWIAMLLEEPEEIEREIFDSEVIQDEIARTSSQISNEIHLLSSQKNADTTSTSIGEPLMSFHENLSVELTSGNQQPFLPLSTHEESEN